MSAPIFLEQTDKNFSLMDSDNRTYSLMGWIAKMEAYARFYHQQQVKNVDVGSVVKSFVCEHPENERTWMRSGKASFCNKCEEIEDAKEIVNAWESLKEGNYDSDTISDWLMDDMKPVIDKFRAKINAL